MKLFKMLFTAVCSIILTVTFAQGVSASGFSQRLAGNDRYETAIEISKSGWEQSEYAIFAVGDNFPDALCAAPLAKKYDAPILLVQKNQLGKVVETEIARLGVKKAFLIGGQGVISPDVENKLKSMNIEPIRLGGKDRYETSIIIAEKLGEVDKAVIATGNDFADALSISPIAASQQMPILLTEKKSIPDSVKKYIANMNIKKTYIVGGIGVIGEEVEKILPGPERLSGNDRYETNFQIIKKFSSVLDFKNVFISTGKDFPDALASSSLAGKNVAPLVLVDKAIINASIDLINLSLPNRKTVIVLGGEAIVSSKVYEDIIKKSFAVVIDAGHGGFDPGAIGKVLGIKEKDVALSVSLKLGKILKDNGIKVIYTRESDIITWSQNQVENLQARVDISNSSGADLFISIHNNSFTSPTANGTETYAYSRGGQSEELAKLVQRELINKTGLLNRGVKTANFYVLAHNDIPAILTELAFISNENEEKLLASDDFQNKCAEALSKAIIEYLKG